MGLYRCFRRKLGLLFSRRMAEKLREEPVTLVRLWHEESLSRELYKADTTARAFLMRYVDERVVCVSRDIG